MQNLTVNTKLGTVICGVGMAIYQTVDLCPVDSWVPWIKWVGAIIAILGGSQAVFGLTHKVDKVVANQNTLLPVIITWHRLNSPRWSRLPELP